MHLVVSQVLATQSNSEVLTPKEYFFGRDWLWNLFDVGLSFVPRHCVSLWGCYCRWWTEEIESRWVKDLIVNQVWCSTNLDGRRWTSYPVHPSSLLIHQMTLSALRLPLVKSFSAWYLPVMVHKREQPWLCVACVSPEPPAWQSWCACRCSRSWPISSPASWWNARVHQFIKQFFDGRHLGIDAVSVW